MGNTKRKKPIAFVQAALFQDPRENVAIANEVVPEIVEAMAELLLDAVGFHATEGATDELEDHS